MKLPKYCWSLVAAAALAVGFVVMLDNPPLVDEIQHLAQTYRFARFDWSMERFVTVIPGYHFSLAVMATVTGWYSLTAMRFFNLLFALAGTTVFFVFSREKRVRQPAIRTLQFTFLPILFPYFFLVYTDVLSMMLVLLLFLFTIKDRFVLAGFFGLLACLVRQNNILWVMMAMGLAYLIAYGWQRRPPANWLRSFWVFLLTAGLFVAFVIFNGGVSIGDSDSHPSFAFHLTNVWFLLFLSFFLFLPLVLSARNEILARAGSVNFWAMIAVLAVAFMVTFINDHPYNTKWEDYYLRNRLLMFVTSAWWWKAAFFVPTAIACTYFAVIPLRRHWWLLYPTTVLFLVPSWLVEQRYYIIPIVLFLLARRSAEPVTEWVQLMWFMLGAAATLAVINSGTHFL